VLSPNFVINNFNKTADRSTLVVASPPVLDLEVVSSVAILAVLLLDLAGFSHC